MDRDTNVNRIAEVQRQLAEVVERIERERALIGRLALDRGVPRTDAWLDALLRKRNLLQRELDDLRTWLGYATPTDRKP